MRRMNRSDASTTPTWIATVRSTATVSANVVTSTSTSLRGARRRRANTCHSLMLYATTSRIPASVAIGIHPAHGPAATRITSRTTACTIPATGVRPPTRTLVAVRAIAPVAGIPPNSGDARLAMP